MKRVHETFDDAEFDQLKQAKGSVTWHDFFMAFAGVVPTLSTPKQAKNTDVMDALEDVDILLREFLNKQNVKVASSFLEFLETFRKYKETKKEPVKDGGEVNEQSG